jgi:Uma2 family endonuclease
MSALAHKRLDVDEFLRWAEGREGKWELYDGAPVAMSPERVVHNETKGEVFVALRAAIRASGARCRAYSDGFVVRIHAKRAFVPDCLVICPPPPRDAVETSNPRIVVEVLSPSTIDQDQGVKLEGYFSLPSLSHYLIVDPDRRLVTHHSRGPDGVVQPRDLRDGRLRLDPPGIEVAVEDLFASAD